MLETAAAAAVIAAGFCDPSASASLTVVGTGASTADEAAAAAMSSSLSSSLSESMRMAVSLVL